MDVYSAGWDEKWLRRFIARLLAFADLAEQAALRSAPVRWLVLWILRRAEALMEDYVFDVAGAPPPGLEGFVAVGNEPADALRLAVRFRAMAAMLGALLSFAWPWDRRSAYWSGLRRLAFGQVMAVCCRPLSGWTPKLNDTS